MYENKFSKNLFESIDKIASQADGKEGFVEGYFSARYKVRYGNKIDEFENLRECDFYDTKGNNVRIEKGLKGKIAIKEGHYVLICETEQLDELKKDTLTN